LVQGSILALPDFVQGAKAGQNCETAQNGAL
jgi:hypothetical protein